MHSLKRPYDRLIKFIILLSVFVFIMGGISCEVVEVLDTLVENTIELKVMTYNIYHAEPDGPESEKWKNRKEHIVDMIDAHEPDVFGVQEALIGQVNYLNENLPQYAVYRVGREGGLEGETCAIFYLEERFYREDEDTFWFSDTPWRASKGDSDWGDPHCYRICSWVRFVERETGKAFYFYNLHLEHGSHGALARLKSVALLGDKIYARHHPENLFIVVGDFNAEPNEPPIQYVLNYLEYLDTYAETNEDTSEGYTFGAWGGSGMRIDYIFTHPNALLTDSYVLPHNYSDHYPLITKLLLPKELIIFDQLE